jgi:hypothetical protein
MTHTTFATPHGFHDRRSVERILELLPEVTDILRFTAAVIGCATAVVVSLRRLRRPSADSRGGRSGAGDQIV